MDRFCKLSRGEGPQIPSREVDEDLRHLLKEFGPDRKSYHPEYPFWRLQNDDIWVLRDADNLEARKGHTDAKKSELLKYDVAGEFIAPVTEALVPIPPWCATSRLTCSTATSPTPLAWMSFGPGADGLSG